MLVGVRDVVLDQPAVHLAVDVLYHDLRGVSVNLGPTFQPESHLEAVEAPGLRHGRLHEAAFREVLIHDAVTCREEGQHILDEVLFAVCEDC